MAQIQTGSPTFTANSVHAFRGGWYIEAIGHTQPIGPFVSKAAAKARLAAIAREERAQRQMKRYGDGYEIRLSDHTIARIVHYTRGEWYYHIYSPWSHTYGNAIGPFPTRKAVVDALAEIQAEPKIYRPEWPDW